MSFNRQVVIVRIDQLFTPEGERLEWRLLEQMTGSLRSVYDRLVEDLFLKQARLQLFYANSYGPPHPREYRIAEIHQIDAATGWAEIVLDRPEHIGGRSCESHGISTAGCSSPESMPPSAD